MHIFSLIYITHATIGRIHKWRTNQLPVSVYIHIYFHIYLQSFMPKYWFIYIEWFSRYIAEQALEDAVGSDIYMCDMQPLVEGCPCHDIFQCDPELPCLAPVFYASKRPLMATQGFIRYINLCVICASKSEDADGGKIDPDLKMVYANVLPICDTCKSRGEKTFVGRYTNNGKAIRQFIDQNLRSIDVATARN